MSSILSFDIISIVLLCKAEYQEWFPDRKTFLCIPASAVDAVAVNHNGTKKVLANGLITCFINGLLLWILPRSPPNCAILDIVSSILAYDLLAKALRRVATCLLVNNNLWRKLVSWSPIIFDDNLKTTSASFFIADSNLVSYEFDSFTFELLYCVILYW